MVLCQCSQCSKNILSSSNDQPTRGRYVSSRNQRKHQNKDLQKQRSTNELPHKNERASQCNQSGSCSESSVESDVTLDSLSNENEQKLSLPDMASTFMSWLHLHGGMSLDKCRTARDLVLKMINQAEGTTCGLLTDTNFPKDTRTILNRSLNVKLETTVCCPTCYTLFFPPNLPSVCPYRETPRSKPCGTQVFAPKKLFVGGSHQGKFQPQEFRLKRGQAPSIERPLCTFVWQKLNNWLPWFLSIPGIESSIEEWDCVEET
ncbi:hypothetical protein VP01_1751g2 [Puccinia sorghi]|uniref:Uncharacterized protein n=1 Tax=Puccinia sorghi TaxID=27349 RepID=A0A0L6VF56_9BASI|nr:hypothetical protein VP01_1751g2 [Puccinia sorghi]